MDHLQAGNLGISFMVFHPARTLRVRFEMDFQRDEDEQDVVDLYKCAYSVVVSLRVQPCIVD